jgi:hypothetical protein
MWAAKTAKMGYQWNVGDGRNIKFWKIIGLVPALWPFNTGRFIS